MKKFIEKILQQRVELISYDNMDQLPLLYRRTYNLYLMKIDEIVCLLAEPSEDINLPDIRKQQKRLEKLTGLRCVLYLRKLNYYARGKLLEEGLPFVWENKQIYIPFLGMMLDVKADRILPACTKLSFLSQKMLLTALYQGWNRMNVTNAALKLAVTKTSVTRCFDELEVMEIPYLHKESRTRFLSCPDDKKEMWITMLPYMRSPLITEYLLQENVKEILPLSGLSAVCEYSTLQDNEYPTYAIIKCELQGLKLSKLKTIPNGETPGCKIQELGYRILFRDNKVIDPLSAYLLLKDKEKEEPRIGMSVDQMLEDYVW